MKFKPEDFNYEGSIPCDRPTDPRDTVALGRYSPEQMTEWIAAKANHLLEEYLQTLPRIYWNETKYTNEFYIASGHSSMPQDNHNHTALLFDIKEFKK